MKTSAILLVVSWIPLIQILMLRIDAYSIADVNMNIYIPISLLLPILSALLLFKEIRKKTALDRMLVRVLKVVLLSFFTWGIPGFFAYYLCAFDSTGNSTIILWIQKLGDADLY